MRGLQLLTVVGVALSTFAPHADAAPTKVFDWSLASPNFGAFNTSPVIGSGTITATEGTGGAWAVDAITGFFTDLALDGKPTYAVTGVGPVDTNVFGVTNDNEVYPAGPTFLDESGLSFATTTGPIDIFWSPSDNNYEVVSHLGIGTGTFALTAVPLPAALPMFAGALLVAGFFSLRMTRTSQGNATAF